MTIQGKLSFKLSNNSVLLDILKFPLLTTALVLNHLSTDKMIAFMNQSWWGNINKATKSSYLICPTCPKYHPGKPTGSATGYFKLPNGTFEVWQMEFIQLPPSHVYKYVHDLYTFSLH